MWYLRRSSLIKACRFSFYIYIYIYIKFWMVALVENVN